VRLLVHGDEDLIVDIGVDSAPERIPLMCLLGPTYDTLELAGRKLLALFDRAEARDFTDVYALANLYGTNPILDVASHLDAGLTPDLLATSISTAHRFRSTEFPIPTGDVPDMLAFFTARRPPACPARVPPRSEDGSGLARGRPVAEQSHSCRRRERP
jgi:hypothetical protein